MAVRKFEIGRQPIDDSYEDQTFHPLNNTARQVKLCKQGSSRVGASLTSYLDQYLFVTGGTRNGREKKCTDFFMYSIKQNNWYKMPNLKTPYTEHGSCMLGDWLYLIQFESFERLNVSGHVEHAQKYVMKPR